MKHGFNDVAIDQCVLRELCNTAPVSRSALLKKTFGITRVAKRVSLSILMQNV